jgi:hypothetical protein
MWKQARAATPGRGADPVAQYDTKSLGLGHRISAKAWAVLHDQGSTEINIGLLTPATTTVKFLMLFKGSLLPPLTDLLSRIEGSGPQQYASF